ncbi:uncharacterized protein IL334_005235 [Kwoniella shivajii]|uniref:SnoaL-like domain-containing protein n=1 Tax=Kwoniella shivajii TaxID=564305 RepID=A0ABZ1D2K2_9TREE|nr:hypothetical protein IL334_005235 [Kwoniella shivajii]
MTSAPITKTTLSDLHNDPSSISVDPSLGLKKRHLEHVALVLDLFQGHGTMAKIENGFTDDACYEDPVAYAKNRTEVAGQLLHIPTVTSSTKTHKANVIKFTRGVSTTSGTDRKAESDLIEVEFNHDLTFVVGPTYNLDTVLQIYSTPDGIVRLQDRPGSSIPDNGFAMALRKLNGIVAPKAAGVPQTSEEDLKLAKQHEK